MTYASVDELLVAMDRDVTTTRTVLGADVDRP
jgi:riboflavin kinase/FMN adenylyltransferase